VNIISDSFHSVWEGLRVDDDMSSRISLLGEPAIVYVDVHVPEIGQAQSLDLVGVGVNHGLVDVAVVAVPGVPAHGRGHAEPILQRSGDLYESHDGDKRKI